MKLRNKVSKWGLQRYLFSVFLLIFSYCSKKAFEILIHPMIETETKKFRFSFYSLIDRNRNIRQSLFNRLKCKIEFLQAFLEHLFTNLLFVNSQNQTIGQESAKIDL